MFICIDPTIFIKNTKTLEWCCHWIDTNIDKGTFSWNDMFFTSFFVNISDTSNFVIFARDFLNVCIPNELNLVILKCTVLQNLLST